MRTILRIVSDGIDRGLDNEAVLDEVHAERPLPTKSGLNYIQRIRRIKERAK